MEQQDGEGATPMEDRVPGWGEGRSRRLVYHKIGVDAYDNRRISANFASESRGKHAERGVRVEWDGQSKFSLRKLWIYTGPGWLMSIAYLDPGNLESDLQAGAGAGYQLLWVLWWATVLGWIVQTLAARMGATTGKHLAEICRYEYGKKTGLALWIFTELAIIGSDIQEVVGSAIAMKILFGWKLWIGCLVTAADTFTFMLIHFCGVRWLELIFSGLIGVMVVTFSILFTQASPDGSEIMKGWVVPNCSHSGTEYAVAMVGAVIMPHNLFLHSALVQSRKIDRRQRGAVREANFYFMFEGAVSLLVSFWINLTIMAVFAAGGAYFEDVGLKNAGDYLKEKFGASAQTIWAIGLLAAGQSSTMTGTFAGQYAMQGFLDINWAVWKRTLLTRSIALIPSLLFAAAFAENNTLMDSLNEWLNVQQSVQLPFALIPLLAFNCNERIMGDFRLKGWKMWVMWFIAAFIIGINVYLTVSSVLDMVHHKTWPLYFGIAVFMIIYLVFNAWIIYDGWLIEKWARRDEKRIALLQEECCARRSYGTCKPLTQPSW